MKKKKAKERSAGFIVVRRRGSSWEVLGLRVWGKIDIPKGHLEPDETDLEAALRECYEEAGIEVKVPDDMIWGDASYIVERPHKDVAVFLAVTDQEPIIRINPETKQYEHDGYHWLAWEEIKNRSYPYLRPAIEWAQRIVEKTVY